MAKYFYESLAHLLVAADGIEHSEGLQTALKAAGADPNYLSAAQTLADTAEELAVEKVKCCGEDRIREHSTHAAATEVEMWHQTVVRAAKKGDLEGHLLKTLGAKNLHSHDHTATVAARAERALALIASHGQVANAFGEERKVRDVLNKGQSLLKRLYAATELRLAPMSDQKNREIFPKLKSHHDEMNLWLKKALSLAESVAEKDDSLLGWFGLVPDGVGVPIGGTAYSVTLHERGQTDPPDPLSAKVCSGWSIGRQGNRENASTGFVD